MSVKNVSPFPLYFQIPKSDELALDIDALDSSGEEEMQRWVYPLSDANGKRKWGEIPLNDVSDRYIAAFLERTKAQFQSYSGCSDRVADLVMRSCPLVDRHHIEPIIQCELAIRMKCLSVLEKLQGQLNVRYPHLQLGTSDGDDIRSQAWRSHEAFILTFPSILESDDLEQISHFCLVVQELINGNYDRASVGVIIDRLLLKESRRPLSSDLDSCLKLRKIQAMAKMKIASGTLARAKESLYKDIFVISSSDTKEGKVKPLHPRDAEREVYAYHCDRTFGFGMTAPTEGLRLGNLFQRVEEIRRAFESAKNSERKKDDHSAEKSRRQAFELLSAPDFPSAVRNAIFGEMYHLCGEHRIVDGLGEKLFYGLEKERITDAQRAFAIQSYMNSSAFKEHMMKFGLQGSVQIWKNHCSRAYELIVQDPKGGDKLMTAPKALVHLYALLGILKGSKDCSSGNTLVEFDFFLQRVVNFWDMDDERSMPPSHDFRELRLWQMGLPQCAEPFDRATLLLFTDPSLLQKMKRLQSSPYFSRSEHRAQMERLEKIVAVFAKELSKDQITLTPRELFFTLFPGSKEEFEKCADEVKSPIETFEFNLGNMGRGAWYSEIEDEVKSVRRNMQTLFSSN
ncbi:MAG: hypothetical protein JSS60_00940 [Verrucomicrobia bacterium]|nr:hypothetical protein [Verrucomicrobiota bacterium]